MRRERLVVAERPDHSLATFNRREDERLEADASSSRVKAQRAIAAANPDGPKQLVVQAAGDDLARWPSEIAVVRFLAVAGPPRARARDLGGELGRSLNRHALGTGAVATSTRAFEPTLGDHHLAAWGVWQALSPRARNLLERMFVSLRGSVQSLDGGAQKVAPRVRELVREGAVLEADGELRTVARVGVASIEASKLTPTWLLALVLGAVAGDAEEDAKQRVTGALAREVHVARCTFRDGLRKVDLSDAHHQVHRPLLIPPPRLADIERERATETIVCAGPIEHAPVVVPDDKDAAEWIAAHPRPRCDVATVTADTSSWRRCDRCGMPRR